MSLHFHKKSGLSVNPDSGAVVGKRGKLVGGIDRKTGYILVSYGSPTTGGVTSTTAHRLIFEAVHGEIPAGYEIGHKNHCKTDNRLSNLELVSHAENAQDTHDLKAARVGEGASLAPSVVRDIVSTRGRRSEEDWAAELGVSAKCIEAIRVEAHNAAVAFARSIEDAWKIAAGKDSEKKPAARRKSRSKKTKAA